MKIENLRIENFKNVATLDVSPSGHHVMLEGRNGTGKSSVMEAILASIRGKKALPEDPVFHGEERGSIKTDLGEYRIEMAFDGERNVKTYKVFNRDGELISDARKVLDSIFGDSTIDATAFERLSAVDQRKYLLAVAGIDTAKWDRQIKTLEDARRDAGRDEERLSGALASLPRHRDAPAEEVDVSAAAQRLRDLDAANSAIIRKQEQAKVHARQVAEAKSSIYEIEMRLKEAQGKLQDAQDRLDMCNAQLVEMPRADQAEIDAAKKIIDEAGAINKRVQQNKQYDVAKQAASKAMEVKEQANAAVSSKRAELLEKIKALDLSAIGIEITDDAVMLHGRLFKTSSTGQRMRSSSEIAMLGNPALKILFFESGALIDEVSMREIIAMADARGYQCIIERTTGAAELQCIVIEDRT